jgi:hypothetical protein
MLGNTMKVHWSGRIIAVQPRIRLTRSFDERYHSYQGFVLLMDGVCGGSAGEFVVAIGKAAQEKHGFRTGMEVRGEAVAVEDSRKETAGYYKASGLTIVRDAADGPPEGPPFLGVPPALEVYRARGHRRLDTRTYAAKCHACMWGCRMPVEMIVDQWNPSLKKYRFETFCYGPKNCALYRSGPARVVPGRKGMSYTEEDWVDEDATAHREEDE